MYVNEEEDEDEDEIDYVDKKDEDFVPDLKRDAAKNEDQIMILREVSSDMILLFLNLKFQLPYTICVTN